VVSEAWDAGWSASVDDAPAPIVRVNHAEMAIALAPGIHRVLLSYRTPGLAAGAALAALAAAGLGLAAGGVTRRKRS
jgi:uncharacterized membrane protein YfhO